MLIRNGTVFLNGKFEKKDILIENSRISKISASISATEESINAQGMLVLPGLIDPHVHLREPGDTYKEDFHSGSRAAIAGGFTTVMDMPNNPKPTVTKERLEEKIRLAKEKAVCDILFHFGGTDDNFEEIKKANPDSLKLYLGHTTGGMILKNPDSLEKHFLNFPKEKPIVLHACDHSDDEEKNLEKTYATVQNAINLASKIDRKIHLAHASTKKEITIAKKFGKCTVEVAPHHLFLSSTNDGERLGRFAKVYPPLRTEQKRIGLLSSFELVDCIATDHAPHTVEDKEMGAAGFPGLETSLGLMLHGCNLGLFDKIGVVQRMSENVAKIFNIKDKGKIEPGFIADITIVDPKKDWKVDPTEFYTKCKWTPFDGMELKGKVHSVVKSGRIVFSDYRFA